MRLPACRALSVVLAAVIGVSSACARQAINEEEVDAPIVILPTPDWRKEVKELKLSNGMTILLRENHAAPAVTWMVFYRVGARNEGAGNTGSAHLLEHMLFKGTRQFAKGQISQVLGRNGARFNATTNADFTNYYETYSSDRLELGLTIESDRMRNALILDSERQPEMTVVRNELERGENEPENNLYHQVKAAAYLAHPYHHPIIGYRSDVEGIKTNSLRQMYDTYYQPNNAVAVLVGDFKTAQASQLIRRYFEGIPSGPKPPDVHTKEEPQVGERRVVLRRRGETNLVHMAYHIPATEAKETAPLAVVESILSEGNSARLQRALVDAGLATATWADADQLKDPGLFWFGATLRPGVTHDKIEAALDAEITRIRTQPVSPGELRQAKNQAEADYAFKSDGTSGVAWGLGTYSMLADWQRFYELLDEMRAVTAKDVQDVANKFLVPENRTVGWYVATKEGPRQARDEAGSKATAAKGTPPERFPTQEFETKPAPLQPPSGLRVAKLDNGLAVAILENHSNPTVAIEGYVKVGKVLDRAEQGGRYGTAGMTATLLDKGTAKRTKARIARDLESVGASLVYSTSSEQTSFRGAAVAKDWGRLLETLIETLRVPAFPEAEVQLAKDLAAAGILQADEQPAVRAQRVLMQTLYPEGHPFHIPSPDAALADLKALTSVDLGAFHKRFYGPNITALSIVGDVDPDVVVQKLNELCKGWTEVEDIDPNKIPGWTIPRQRTDRPLIQTILDKSNVEIRLGHVANLRRKDREFYAARVMNHILGGSALTGRLGLKLRDEMGLTYGTSSSLSAGRIPGPWIASVTVNRANVPAARAAMRDVINTYLKEGPNDDEVADARSALIGGQAVSLSSNAGMASSLSDILYYGFDPKSHWQNVQREYGAVTLEKVVAASRKLLHPEDAVTVIAGPYDEHGTAAGAPSGENVPSGER